MKQNRQPILVFALVVLLSSCLPGTGPLPATGVPAAALVPTDTPQQPQPGAAGTPVLAPTETVAAAPAIHWPTQKITVDNIDSLRLLQSWGKGRADQVFKDPGSDIVVVAGAGRISVYQGAAFTPLYQLSDVQAVAVSFTSNVVVASYQGQSGKVTPVKIYDLKSGEVRAEVSHKLDHYSAYVFDDLQRARAEGWPDVSGMALSPDGISLAVGFGDGSLEVWNIAGVPASITRQAYGLGPNVIRFSPSGKTLLIGSQFYRFPEMKLVKDWADSFMGPVMPDGKSMFLSKGVNVYQVDTETGKELARIPVDMRVDHVLLVDNGKKLVVYTDRSEGPQDIYQTYRQILSVPDWAVVEPEKKVDAFDQYADPGAQPALTEIGHVPALQGVNIVDGKPVAWGTYGHLPFWWFPTDGKVATVPVPDGTSPGFHYQDQTIVTCGQDALSILSLDGPAKNISVAGLGHCEHVLVNHKGDVVAVSAGPDIGLINLTDAKVRFLQESSQDITSMKFSEDDAVFVAGTDANYDVPASIFFWNGAAGYPISQAIFPEDKNKPPKKQGEVVLERDAAGILNILVSSDDAFGITFTENMRIWNIASGKQIGFIPYSENPSTRTAAISPDQNLLVLGDWHGQLQFWDLGKMAEISVLMPGLFKAHNGPVNAITFNQDGTAILTAGEDGTIHLWGIP